MGKKTTKRCVSLRMRLREGPVQLAARLGIAPATVYRILTTARMNRLSYADRATGEPIRRYEHGPRLARARGRQEAREHPHRWGWR